MFQLVGRPTPAEVTAVDVDRDGAAVELLSDRNNLFLHSLTCSSKECKDGDGGVYMHGAVSELKTSGCGE